MVRTISMGDMRRLNLFSKITKIQTRFCFEYNNILIFCVPRPMIYKAIGENGRNLRKISEIIRKRVRIIANPKGIQDAKMFIESIVNPLTFKSLEINGEEMVINATRQSKAALIGRDKRRLKEMQEIVNGFFEKELKIA